MVLKNALLQRFLTLNLFWMRPISITTFIFPMSWLQKFQKCEYAKTKLFKTEGRGWGLLAGEDLKVII